MWSARPRQKIIEESARSERRMSIRRESIRLTFLVCLGFCGGALWFLGLMARMPPPFDDFRRLVRSSEITLRDRFGTIIQSARFDSTRRELPWVALVDYSPLLREAVLRSEDRRFAQHAGVDVIALVGAIVHLGSRGGASTISMQLTRLLSKQPAGARNLRGKLYQMLDALALEKAWTKEQVLEAYLNLVPVRGELRGFAAAARGLFGKHPAGLGQEESLILAALLRAPSASAERVAERACQLGRVLHWQIPCDELRLQAQQAFARPFPIVSPVQLAPHVLRRLGRRARPGDSLQSSIDGRLQTEVVEIVQRHLSPLVSRRVRDAAVLVLDNRTGEALSYVGNSGDDSSARYIDGVVAPRQLGSTLKPLLYALALDRRFITPHSLLRDTPLDIGLVDSIYRPRNYDQRYHGLVSAKVALASSLNVPAVRLLQQVGLTPFHDLLGQAGFSGLQPADVYGYALALGVASNSLWELTNAYRMLANGGRMGAATLALRPGGAPSDSILSSGAAYLVGDMLSDRSARALTFGLENVLATPFWSAVKTGTSRDMTDNWCVGYSRDVTVGVWVGNFSGEPMRQVTGIEGAGPIWSEVMRLAHARYGRTNSPPHPPPGVVRYDGHGTAEYYLAGTEPRMGDASGQATLASASPKISYPLTGMTLAIDPDIPPQAQRVRFRAAGAEPGMAWELNGVLLGSVEDSSLWRLVPGRYELRLLFPDHREAERVSFQVRDVAIASSVRPVDSQESATPAAL